MRQKFFFMPLCLLILLMAACSASSNQPTSTLKSGILVTLEPTSSASSTQLQTVSTMISQRLNAFGLKDAQVTQTTTNNKPVIQVKVPHFGGKESDMLVQLLTTGQLEFWLTGPNVLENNTTINPTAYTQYNRGAQAPFSNADLDPSQYSVNKDESGRPGINFSMNNGSSARFLAFTKDNVGQYLTITLDRAVILSGVIQSAIDKKGVIQTAMSEQQARAIVSVLKYAPLPVALRKLSEETF